MGLGYSPTVQSTTWNKIMAQQEAIKLIDVRRGGLMKMMGSAVLGRDAKEVDRVREAIKSFNSGLVGTEYRGKAITSAALRASVDGQARSRAAQEAGTSVRKTDIPIMQEVQKMFPNSEIISARRVKGTF